MIRCKARRRAVHSYYSLWPQAGEACAYCGIYADTYDHVPSLAHVQALGPSFFEEKEIRLWLVPACRECNTALSKCGFYTVGERKRAIKRYLQRRYKRFLTAARWTTDELEELGWGLRTLIENGVNIAEWVRRRLQW